MPSPEMELQSAIHAALVADGALTTLLAGAHVYDQTPPRITLPIVLLAGVSAFDWSTPGSPGDELQLAIEVWSSKQGKAEVMEIMEQVRAVVTSVTIASSTLRLVAIEFVSSEAAYDDQSSAYRGLLNFRALAERIS